MEANGIVTGSPAAKGKKKDEYPDDCIRKGTNQEKKPPLVPPSKRGITGERAHGHRT